jgi:hypothetical protein
VSIHHPLYILVGWLHPSISFSHTPNSCVLVARTSLTAVKSLQQFWKGMVS